MSKTPQAESAFQRLMRRLFGGDRALGLPRATPRRHPALMARHERRYLARGTRDPKWRGIVDGRRVAHIDPALVREACR